MQPENNNKGHDGKDNDQEDNIIYEVRNDDEEFERLHLLQTIVKRTWVSNFSSPIQHILGREGSKVLDVGYVKKKKTKY